MDNRRNYYRVLRVQPDASPEVIRNSYRSILQKLNIHPDLGGENWNASAINQAYTTLRDPQKRAAYDAELMAHYNIHTLSGASVMGIDAEQATADSYDNQRNYYRLLHVQPDAELAVIKASYHVLSDKAEQQEKALLKDAFHVMNDSTLRAYYDEWLNRESHAQAVERLKLMRQEASEKKASPSITNLPVVSEERFDEYIATIKHYCAFCKTPYLAANFMGAAQFCRECESPLSSPSEHFVQAPRRSLTRMQQKEPAYLYEDWPGKAIQTSLENLSPTGLNFFFLRKLDEGQVIKIDARHFKAVGEVVYCREMGKRCNIGVKFVAIEFLRITGSFLSTSA